MIQSFLRQLWLSHECSLISMINADVDSHAYIVLNKSKRFCCSMPRSDFMFDINNPRHFIQSDAREGRHHFDLRIVSASQLSFQPPAQTLYPKKREHQRTHCCTVSQSSALTPILLVPRRCQPDSRFKFWIMIPESTTISVSMSSRMLWSER